MTHLQKDMMKYPTVPSDAMISHPFDQTDYADPLFGVGSATSAGPTLPAGSIHPSPETLEKDCGGYTREQPIVGFGQTYISGSGGVKCYGNYLLAPMVDRVELDSARRASFAVAGSEAARCYEYRVALENAESSLPAFFICPRTMRRSIPLTFPQARRLAFCSMPPASWTTTLA